MTAADRGSEGRQRAEAYWFLATLVAAKPDPEMLAGLAALAAETPDGEDGAAGRLVAALKGEADLDQLAERLAVEHTRLFLGVREGYGPPPPYEGLWRDGALMSPSTVAVASAYLEAGYRHDPHWGPLDHVVEELRFMAALCNAEHEAWGALRIDEAEWSRELQARFLRDHLLAWAPAWCRAVAEQAREPFYQAAAAAIADTLAQDANHVGPLAAPKGER